MKITVHTKNGPREVDAHESGVPGLLVTASTEATGLFALSHSSGVGFSDTRFESVQQARRAAYLLRHIDWSATVDCLAVDNDLDLTLHGIHAWVNGIHIQRRDT